MVSEFFPIFKTEPNILQSELKSTLNSPDEILEVNKYFYASTSRNFYILLWQENIEKKSVQKDFL